MDIENFTFRFFNFFDKHFVIKGKKIIKINIFCFLLGIVLIALVYICNIPDLFGFIMIILGLLLIIIGIITSRILRKIVAAIIEHAC